LSFFGWQNCPANARHQIERLIAGFQEHLASNMIGVYLHGSLAMGCFNPVSSDIDLLVATHHTIPFDSKWGVVKMLLNVSCDPHPVEISFLCQVDLNPWRYPTPFDFHFSEGWRIPFEQALASDQKRLSKQQPATDTDLAAHITITNHRGVRLWGLPIDQVFPAVPEKDYRTSILEDLRWARERLGGEVKLEYGVLNSCRVHAYLRQGLVCSKAEGAAWGLQAFPGEFHPLIQKALYGYQEGKISSQFPGKIEDVQRLIDSVLAGAGLSQPG
jgi:streptomycin 3"-adenylyltransferase